MSGQETFEFAAAVAGVSIGLAAALLLSLLAVFGTWRLFRNASDASHAASRAALSVEELARRLGGPQEASADLGQLAGLREQAEALVEQQRQLQEMARNLLDTMAVEGGRAPTAFEDLDSSVGRLDATVGQMAASLANLIQLLERQQERR